MRLGTFVYHRVSIRKLGKGSLCKQTIILHTYTLIVYACLVSNHRYSIYGLTAMSQEIRSRLEAYRNEKQSLNAAAASPNNNSTDSGYGESESSLSSSQHALAVETDNRKSSWWLTGLKILLWFLLWGFFIEVEFGLAYFVSSGLVFVVLSLRGGRKRKPGELSAYSVFNKNFEAIEGTLSAEQFEKELRYGPSSVR